MAGPDHDPYTDYEGPLAWHPSQSPFELVVSETSDTTGETITILNFEPGQPDIVHSGTSKRYSDPHDRVWTMACEFTSVGETDQQITGGIRIKVGVSRHMDCSADDTIRATHQEVKHAEGTHDKAKITRDDPKIIKKEAETLLKAKHKYRIAVTDWIRNSHPGES